MNVLIVPDKFKGTLTARQAADAIARGWRATRPGDALTLLPMADGGDGFGDVLGGLLHASRTACDTVDCAGRPRQAEWWKAPDGQTALFETAQVNGLALLPPGTYHPFDLDTRGIGEVFRDIRRSGARRVYAGIGGSATNDGGFGLARALGWRFEDEAGRPIASWTGLDRLATLTPPADRWTFEELIIAVDVANPLLGAQGASRIYGPQKGLQPGDVPRAEACLTRLAKTARALGGEDVSLLPGSGAAGGLGFGLKLFCGGTFQSGAAIFGALSRLEERIRETDLVITAEGAFDEQTRMGKGVGVIASEAARAGKRCLCLAGSMSGDSKTFPWPGFQARAIVPDLAPLAIALTHADELLARLAGQAARAF